MNVTKSNFREVLKNFDQEIEKADFVVIDTEFTGLTAENKVLPYDSPENAYRKIAENTSGYILIQLGVTLLRVGRDDAGDAVYRCYNFYVFPRSWRSQFRCQGSSMTFLAEQGFDFTMLFRDGISYCSEQEEKVLRERLQEKQNYRKEVRKNTPETRSSFNHIPVPSEEKEGLERIHKIIEEFLTSNEADKVIGNCNAFQRKLIYEMIEANFADKISASTKTVDNAKVIVINRRSTPEEEDRLEEELKQAELQELEDCIGMSTVLQKISASKKPIVGHNMLLDLMFILRQFFKPLPDDFQEFKKIVHSTFPNIIDTKYMCTLPKIKSFIKSSILADVVQAVSEEPFSLPKLEPDDENYAYATDEKKAHEAGYDSFLTAKAFLGIAKYLHDSLKNFVENPDETKDYLNHVFLLKLHDVGYINLVGIEPIPSRDHVFHVTIPETWKQSDLVNHFRNYGSIFTTWINSTSALISLHNRDNASTVLMTIESVDGFKIQSFADYKESLRFRINSNEVTPSARKRKRDSETISSEEGSQEKRMKKDKAKPLVKTFKESNDW